MTTPCPPRPARITSIEAPGCHFCTDAHDALAALVQQGHHIEISTVDARSADGQTLMQRHRAGLSPLVLVDGAFFSQAAGQSGAVPGRNVVLFNEGAGCQPCMVQMAEIERARVASRSSTSPCCQSS